MTLHGARPRTYSHYKHISIQGGPLRGLRDRAQVSRTKAVLRTLRYRALISTANIPGCKAEPPRGVCDRALVSSTKAFLRILRGRALVSPAQLSIR